MYRIKILPFMAMAALAAGAVMVSQGTEASMSEKATFGAGCFWGVEETFRTLEGVTETRVGFMGGHTEDPSYRPPDTLR